MRKLLVFNNVSLDGFIADASGDMSWARRNDAEWNAFAASNATGDSVFLFGRVTYEMMAAFWPTAMAHKILPGVAACMNSAAKVVFSRTLKEASWSNTRLVKDDPSAEVRRLKGLPGPPLVVLGSASIVSQLAQERLIDELQVAVIPVVLGGGRSMFAGLKEKQALSLVRSRVFGNGNVLLCYEPAPQ